MAASQVTLGELVTFERETSGRYVDQWLLSCRRCAWRDQAAARRIADAMAADHVHTAHGIVIEASSGKPGKTRAAPQQNRAWQAAGVLASPGRRA